MYQELPERHRAMHTPTARAAVVSSYMVWLANEALAPVEEVRIFPNHVSRIYLVRDRVLIRFKKLDQTLLSSNYPTSRSELYNGMGYLPEIAVPALRVDIGYKLNVVESAIEQVFVVRRRKKKVLWSFDLAMLAAGEIAPEQIPLDAPAAAEVLPRIRRRIDPNEVKILPFKQATTDE